MGASGENCFMGCWWAFDEPLNCLNLLSDQMKIIMLHAFLVNGWLWDSYWCLFYIMLRTFHNWLATQTCSFTSVESSDSANQSPPGAEAGESSKFHVLAGILLFSVVVLWLLWSWMLGSYVCRGKFRLHCKETSTVWESVFWCPRSREHTSGELLWKHISEFCP